MLTDGPRRMSPRRRSPRRMAQTEVPETDGPETDDGSHRCLAQTDPGDVWKDGSSVSRLLWHIHRSTRLGLPRLADGRPRDGSPRRMSPRRRIPRRMSSRRMTPRDGRCALLTAWFQCCDCLISFEWWYGPALWLMIKVGCVWIGSGLSSIVVGGFCVCVCVCVCVFVCVCARASVCMTGRTCLGVKCTLYEGTVSSMSVNECCSWHCNDML